MCIYNVYIACVFQVYFLPMGGGVMACVVSEPAHEWGASAAVKPARCSYKRDLKALSLMDSCGAGSDREAGVAVGMLGHKRGWRSGIEQGLVGVRWENCSGHTRGLCWSPPELGFFVR